MKRLIWLVLFIFALSACTQENAENAAPSKEPDVEDSQAAEDDENEEKQVEEEKEIESNEETPEAIYEVDEHSYIKPIKKGVNEEVVLLTIDDAPEKYALTMAKILHELDAPAIFFVNGHFLETEEEKETLKEIYDLGFIIGNHTYSHQDLKSLPEDEQREEIVRVNDMVEEIIGERPVFFRAPFGHNTDFSRQVIENENMTSMNWVYGYDWDADYMEKESLTDIMLNTELLSDGANLLMHDREWTADALQDIVTGLRDKGYEILNPALIKTN